MKQSQIVLSIVLLAAMVFGITFALNYLGNSGTTGPKIPDDAGIPTKALELVFGGTYFPPEGYPYKEEEFGQKGYQDFWFVNPHDQPVAIGLEGTSCTCAEAFVFMLAEEWRARRSALLGGQLTGQAAGVLSALPMAMALEEEPEVKSMAKAAKALPLTKTDTVKVPAHKVGWVRLGWTAIQPGQTAVKNLGAAVWMGQRGLGKAVLQTNVHYVEPLLIVPWDQEQSLGDLNPNALPVHRSVVCWSGTRATLDLNAQMVSLRGRPDLDPFVVGAPVALSVAECRKLDNDLSKWAESTKLPRDASQVLCAYRIPVTLRGSREAGGKATLDVGPFRRQVLIRLAGEDIDPKLARLEGAIQGDVFVSGSEDSSRIVLGLFDRDKGTRKNVRVWSQTPGLQLEVDRDRTAAFFGVELSEPKSEGDKQVWQLNVEVKPKQVRGRFPRDDDPVYRDSSIYLHGKGSNKWALRIPVDGMAEER